MIEIITRYIAIINTLFGVNFLVILWCLPNQIKSLKSRLKSKLKREPMA